MLQMPILLIANFAIFFGPFLLMAVSQIRSYEPGDADWGVKLEDVRGQAEAKEEVRQVVTLWQSGEAFERAGGKRERGLLMLGAPGTGKTMLSKAIATGFNCPFVSIPGPGSPACSSAWMRSRCASWPAAPRSSRPSGAASASSSSTRSTPSASAGRASAPAVMTGAQPVTMEELCFYGPNGSLTPTGDLVLETRAWRERLFADARSRPRAKAGQASGGS